MKIKNSIYILLTCYAATFLRLFINNNFIVSIIGSLLFGVLLAKKLDHLTEKFIFNVFFPCFTSYSGFIYFLYKISNQENFISFIFWFNFIIVLNLFAMYSGFLITRKFT